MNTDDVRSSLERVAIRLTRFGETLEHLLKKLPDEKQTVQLDVDELDCLVVFILDTAAKIEDAIEELETGDEALKDFSLSVALGDAV